MQLQSDVKEIKGVGDQLARQLYEIGISTIGDLVDYLPRKYNDFSNVSTINRMRPGIVTIKVEISQANGRYVRRGMHITEAIASDSSGSVRLVWFNQPYRASSIKPGTQYFVSGLFELRRQRFSITNPSIELVSDFPVSTARIVPVYKERKDLKSTLLRKLIRECMPVIRSMPETLPDWLVSKYKLQSLAKAYETLHFPVNNEELVEAQRRFGFEEVFRLNLASLLNRAEVDTETAPQVSFDQDVAKRFVDHLPFALTNDQRRVIWQIYLDMQKTRPMNRLVEGDVGSGKTVVAVMAALMALNAGYQALFMAPTELLARQHAETIYKLLRPLGQESALTLLTGAMKSKQKEVAHKTIKAGSAKLIVGTHALLEEKVVPKKLGLIIIDEQHRFGVEQRKKLQTKAGYMPHILSLSATPIPRSLALTLYGELDISAISEKPAGRKPVITKITSPNSSAQLYKKVDQQIESGRQVFVVCPLISESENRKEKSVETVFKELSSGEFKHRKVGLLHGKMKASEKQSVMSSFVKGEIDILVATTVVEVGVDVPNATIMIIEGAERFGLAQIHQLRGRVGRSDHQGYCYLMLSDSLPPSRRLTALESSSDGFRLAELDLEIRGPGAIYGTVQHGALDLRVAKLTDMKLILAAKQAAQEFLNRKEDLLSYNELAAQVKVLRAVTTLN